MNSYLQVIDHIKIWSLFYAVATSVWLYISWTPTNQNATMMIMMNKVSKVGDRSWGQSEGSLFNSYYAEV